MASEQGPSLVRWTQADIQWTPNSYVFEVPAMFEQRAEHYLAKRLGRQLLPDATWELTPGRIMRDEHGTRAEDGYIRLATPKLFDIDPKELKTFLNDAVEKAVLAGEQAEQRDQGRAGEFLAVVRA